jgi:hypothetical protein
MGDLPSRDDLLKVMGLIGGHGEPANILHTTAEHLRACLPAASPAFVLDVALGLLDILDQEHAEMDAWKQVMDRERAENAAMRPIMEAMAHSTLRWNKARGTWTCDSCDGMDQMHAAFKHDKDCPVTQARALLAKES